MKINSRCFRRDAEIAARLDGGGGALDKRAQAMQGLPVRQGHTGSPERATKPTFPTAEGPAATRPAEGRFC